jgi:hypothetical protein
MIRYDLIAKIHNNKAKKVLTFIIWIVYTTYLMHSLLGIAKRTGLVMPKYASAAFKIVLSIIMLILTTLFIYFDRWSVQF